VVLPEDGGLSLLRSSEGTGGAAQCLYFGQVLGVALVSGGGPDGRNCDGALSANGVMVANWRNSGAWGGWRNSGGVGCQSPGALPTV
jgi:hypothetical protein